MNDKTILIGNALIVIAVAAIVAGTTLIHPAMGLLTGGGIAYVIALRLSGTNK